MDDTHGPGAGPCFSVPSPRPGNYLVHTHAPEQDEELVTVSDTQVTWRTQEAYDGLTNKKDEYTAVVFDWSKL